MNVPANTRLASSIKDVRANSSISAMRSPYYPFLEESAMLGVIDAAVVGAGANTRLESRIKKFRIHDLFLNPLNAINFFIGSRPLRT